MGNIQIKGLPTKQDGGYGYTYSDIHLDITPRGNKGGEMFQEKTVNDIEADYDGSAIINSIKNLFTTSEGQKILNPEYGLDLTRYLFGPADVETAKSIKSDIYSKIARFEPRVKVQNVKITVFEDVNEYDIEIIINIPALNINNVSIFGGLKHGGYVFTK